MQQANEVMHDAFIKFKTCWNGAVVTNWQSLKKKIMPVAGRFIWCQQNNGDNKHRDMEVKQVYAIQRIAQEYTWEAPISTWLVAFH